MTLPGQGPEHHPAGELVHMSAVSAALRSTVQYCTVMLWLTHGQSVVLYSDALG